MKKLISMILAVLMTGLCACGIAEETEQAGDLVFLRIKEGVTAQVFEKPGDEKAIDTLSGGRICGLLGEETAEDGTAWFRVFYLNSQKAGATGYISTEDAEKLTGDQLEALMGDPATLNEILDLIDAMNAYLSKKDEKKRNGGEEQESELKKLYDKAMAELKKLFGTDVSSELDNLAEEGKELANKAKEAGEALLDEAKEAGKDLMDGVTDALSSVDGEKIGETFDNLKDDISEAVTGWIGESSEGIDEAIQEMTDALKELNGQLGEDAGKSIENFANFVNETKDWLNGSDFSKVNDAVNDLAAVFEGYGFTEGTGENGVGSFLDELNSIFPQK